MDIIGSRILRFKVIIDLSNTIPEIREVWRVRMKGGERIKCRCWRCETLTQEMQAVFKKPELARKQILFWKLQKNKSLGIL